MVDAEARSEDKKPRRPNSWAGQSSNTKPRSGVLEKGRHTIYSILWRLEEMQDPIRITMSLAYIFLLVP